MTGFLISLALAHYKLPPVELLSEGRQYLITCFRLLPCPHHTPHFTRLNHRSSPEANTLLPLLRHGIQHNPRHTPLSARNALHRSSYSSSPTHHTSRSYVRLASPTLVFTAILRTERVGQQPDHHYGYHIFTFRVVWPSVRLFWEDPSPGTAAVKIPTPTSTPNLHARGPTTAFA